LIASSRPVPSQDSIHAARKAVHTVGVSHSYVSDATKLLMAEHDENTERKHFTWSEKVSLGRALGEVLTVPAKKRQEEVAARANAIRAGQHASERLLKRPPPTPG
jgi:hypothetical protein